LLAHPNVGARVKGEGVLMHLKAYAVDGAVLRTGSGNFSRSGLASQDNDAILITDSAVVDAFEGNFERIWARAKHRGPERFPLSNGGLDGVRLGLARIVARLRQPQWGVALVTLIERLGAEHADSFHASRGRIALRGQN
jgi:phosphatidylserine/phosphatidylglycerophosphate/cardiolipin synthase-like enzyme